MGHLIDKTWFRGNRYVGTSRPNDPDSRDDGILDEIIDRTENYVLSNALGIVLYKELIADIDTNTIDNLSLNFQELVFGKEYDGKVWSGLIDKNLKRSLLVDYGYCLYWYENTTQHNDYGATHIAHKVGEKVSMTKKMYDAQISFLAKYGSESYYSGDYVPIVIDNRLNNDIGIVFGGNTNFMMNGEVSLTQFLTENEQSYPSYQGSGYVKALVTNNSWDL